MKYENCLLNGHACRQIDVGDEGGAGMVGAGVRQHRPTGVLSGGLLADAAGGHYEGNADAQQHNNEASPARIGYS